MFLGRLDQQFDQGHVGAVGHAHGHVAADAHVIAMGQIGDLVGDKIRIWDKDFRVFIGLNHGVADIHALHLGPQPVDLDDVAGLDGTVEKQDQAADEITDHGLHAKTDAYGKAAGNDREVGQTDAEQIQADQNEEQPHAIHADALQGRGRAVVDVFPAQLIAFHDRLPGRGQRA